MEREVALNPLPAPVWLSHQVLGKPQSSAESGLFIQTRINCHPGNLPGILFQESFGILN
jgi:hypothetical protein